MQRKFDLMFCNKGSGITVANRAILEHGDYKNIAHISDEGVITYYEKNLPAEIIKQIEAMAEKDSEDLPHLEKLTKERAIIIEYKVDCNFLHVLYIDITGDMWHGTGT